MSTKIFDPTKHRQQNSGIEPMRVSEHQSSSSKTSEDILIESKSICPICHKPNHCAMTTTAKNADQCWCTNKNIPQGLIDQLPKNEIGNRCICQQCVDVYNKK